MTPGRRMAKELITTDARPAKAAVLRAYLFREGAVLVGALAVLFVVVRLLLPRLVNAHNDLLLVLCGVLALAALAGVVWFAFYARARFRAFQDRYRAARDD